MKKRFSLLKLLLLAAAIIVLFVRGCSCDKEDDETDDISAYLSGKPTAQFTIYPATGTTGQLFEFDAGSSKDGLDPDSVLRVRWDLDGDGTWDTPLTTVKYITHMYSLAGNYNVKLEVLDTDNYNDIETKNLEVTSSGLPTITTNDVTSVTATTAVCGGEVTDEGSSLVTGRGVCWSPLENPTIYNSVTNDGNGPGAFISLITELNPDRNYYVRAYAKNDLGVVYGEQKFFRTDTAGGIPCPGTPTVTWQGQTYHTVLIGDQCWMKSNLNWETGNSWCYNDNPLNCSKWGRLYDWETMMNGEGGSISVPSGVQGICPDGWHIPSDEEWKILERIAETGTGNDTIWDNNGWRGYNVGKNLKSEDGWGLGNGIDKFNFTAYPGGYRDLDGIFHQETSQCFFWTCTESLASYSFLRSLSGPEDRSYRAIANKEFGHSVRCLKD